MELDVGTDYTDKKYNSELTKSDLPGYTLTPALNNTTELICGFPCTANGKKQTFKDSSGNERQYMCGSTTYPDIKTPPRFTVYKITSN